VFMKRLNNFVDARLKDATDALISIGSRVNSLESRTAVLEKESASSEIQRWQTGQIKGIQDRLKDLEQRTTPPAGLDETIKGSPAPDTKTKTGALLHYARKNGTVTTAMVAEDFDVSINVASARLAYLVRTGQMVKVCQGVYSVRDSRTQAQRLQQVGSPRQVNQRV
jgi:predicted HTH transcriptional regulator